MIIKQQMPIHGEREAAFCIQQTRINSEPISRYIRELAHSPEKRLTMAKAAYQLRQREM